MKQPILTVVTLIAALLWRLCASANDITVDRFSATASSATYTIGGSNNPTGLFIQSNGAGTPITVNVVLRRPDTSQDYVGVALFIAGGSLPAPTTANKVGIGGTTSTTPNGDNFQLGSNDVLGNQADWQIDPTNIRSYLLDMSRNPKFSFSLTGGSPGVNLGATGSGRRFLYLVLYDVADHTIFSVSAGIPLDFTYTPPGAASQPALYSLSASSGYRQTFIDINGRGLSNAKYVFLNGKQTSFTISNDNLLRFRVPVDATSGQVVVAVDNFPSSNALPFTVLNATYSPVIGGFSTGYGYNGLSSSPYDVRALTAGEPVSIYNTTSPQTIPLSNFGIIAVDFNGVRTRSFSFSADGVYLVTTAPDGITPGPVKLITANLGNSNSIPFRLPRPLTPECGLEICGDQYVASGARPKRILGRVLFTNEPPGDESDHRYNFDYKEIYYYTQRGYFKEDPNRPSYDEAEAVQWQYSYNSDNTGWQDIPGAIYRDYQPGPVSRTTYYRRSSSHMMHSWWRPDFRDHWYDSNIVTITPYQPVNNGTYTLYNRNSGQVLEIGGGATLTQGTIANQWPSTGTANQQWTLVMLSDGAYKIINRNSSQALEIGSASTTPGAAANQWPYLEGKNQQWQVIPVSSNSNYVRIINVNSGQVLEIGGGNPNNTYWGSQANQYLPTAGDSNYAQQWQLVPVNAPVASSRFPGVYTIRNVASSKVLEIGGAGASDGDAVRQWTDTGTASQQWVFEDAGGGLFNIKNRNSNKSLDVYMAGLNDGTLVQQYGYGGSNNQKWEVFELRPNVFRITSYHTIAAGAPKSLDIDSYRIKDNGVQVQQRQYSGTANQEWVISYVSSNRMAGPPANMLPQPPAQSTSVALMPTTLSLYPNPASTTLTVSLSNNTTITKLTIWDLRGAVVLEREAITNGQIDISSLATGMYLITVNDGTQEYRQKFSKQ